MNPAEPDNEDVYYCTDCGGRLTPEDKVCPHCGADTSEFIDEETAARFAEKYPALRTISTLFKALAVINALGTLILVLSLLSSYASPIAVIGTLWFGVLSTVLFLAVGESIKVAIDIEHATRTIVELLKYKNE